MSQPAPPAPQHDPPRPTERRPSSRLVLGLLVLSLVAVAVLLVIVISNNGDKPTDTPTPTPSATTSTSDESPVGIDAPVAGYVPAATDFALELVVLEEKCFGSAGCNVTFTLKVNYLGSRPPDANRTFTAIYDVTGGTEPLTNRFTIRGDQVSIQSQDFIQTDSPDAVLVATVTQTL